MKSLLIWKKLWELKLSFSFLSFFLVLVVEEFSSLSLSSGMLSYGSLEILSFFLWMYFFGGVLVFMVSFLIVLWSEGEVVEEVMVVIFFFC